MAGKVSDKGKRIIANLKTGPNAVAEGAATPAGSGTGSPPADSEPRTRKTMPAGGNSPADNDAAFTLSIRETNRQDAIKFYKSMAAFAPGKIPADMLSEESASRVLEEAEARRKRQLASLPGLPKGSPALDAAVAKLCLAAYLIDRTKKIGGRCIRENRLGMFSLYLSLRQSVAAILGEDYYGRDPGEILLEYADAEPLLYACSELCGLKPATLDEAMAEYKKRLVDELRMA